jgi:NADPH-dependent 2,4-dienoyl-CoA reductase/sulfur reductase-like enzyme/nitrite reductase/ring-hydroxylating ferredoxin subunit
VTEQSTPNGPDLAKGVSLSDFKEGKLAGHVAGEEILLVRGEGGVFAVGAHCTHYHAPLADGLVTGNSIRCPWHHACFDLQSGEAVRAPAISSLSSWKVEERDGRILVHEKEQTKPKLPLLPDATIKNIVIVGGGAAGFAAAEMLRRRQFRGHITMLSGEASAPVDRPNLSKDYLAGSAPEDWLPLKPDSYYREADLQLRLNTEVQTIDSSARRVLIAGGESFAYDRLLLATGAQPLRLSVPGADQPHVHTLRSIADCRSIIHAAKEAKRTFIIGASFIGLEAAAALRTRGIEVHVVAPEKRPMERVFGAEMGDFIRGLHEEHGVIFHLEDSAVSLADRKVKLKSGAVFDCDLVVVGIGVRPRLALAEQAGLKMDRGVLVDEYLQTSMPGIYAAGDIARWPDPRSKANIRVEHWALAERQGQAAAINMLGGSEKFDAVPFFWSQHYDIPINYVGHAEGWDAIEVEGDIQAKDCLVRYKKNGRVCAVASIFRDLASLQAEVEMEGSDAAK